MKKALLFSIFIHAFVFAADFGLMNLSNNPQREIPLNFRKGLSVEIISPASVPSSPSHFQSVKRNIKKNLKNSVSTNNGDVKDKRNQNQSSMQRKATMSLRGKIYKQWLLEYYSVILKNIKIKLEEIGVQPGNVSLIITVSKTGIIKKANIVKSAFNLSIESRIRRGLYRIILPAFPEALNKEKLTFKLNVIYQ